MFTSYFYSPMGSRQPVLSFNPAVITQVNSSGQFPVSEAEKARFASRESLSADQTSLSTDELPPVSSDTEPISKQRVETEKLAPVTELLVDPITRKRYKIASPYDDELLRLNGLDKLKLSLENTFVKIPYTIYKGLRGDRHFTFYDHLNVSSVPYYLGGAFLAMSARMGRDNLNFSRQGVGVLLYYLGVMAANKGVNAFYKANSGVDLELKYRKYNGDIEDVFASADFFRSDLLDEQKDYKPIRHKNHIPDNIADSKREVQDYIRSIIIAARFDKLILANALAALGAGYLARSDAWARLPGGLKSLRNLWCFNNKEGGNFSERLVRTGQAIRGAVGPALKETILGYAGEKNPMWRKGLFGGILGLTGLLLAHGWYVMGANRNRQYESPFLTNLSPALSPELSYRTAAVQSFLPGGLVSTLPRKGVFEVVQQIEHANRNGGGQP
jgi:hypothetical protein